MTRLAGYLIRLFSSEALALFALASALLFLGQSLRLFDVVAVKGQDIPTLLGQVFLTMPTLAIAYAPVCIAIGLARGLKTLQQNNELHIIHASRRVRALVGGISGYVLICATLMVLLTSFVEPLTRRYYNQWTATVAADLVGRLLTPHKFVEVTPGVTLVIGSRGPGGELGSFFADDNRNPQSRQTYIAESATVAADDEGYLIQLKNGSIEYMTDDFRFSQISFTRYDLAVGRLTDGVTATTADGMTTIDFIAEAVAKGSMDRAIFDVLLARFGEGTRVIAFCFIVAALAFFPHARRAKTEVPLEIFVLGVAFAERAALANLPPLPAIFASWGSVALIVGSLAFLLIRARWRPAQPMQEAPA